MSSQPPRRGGGGPRGGGGSRTGGGPRSSSSSGGTTSRAAPAGGGGAGGSSSSSSGVHPPNPRSSSRGGGGGGTPGPSSSASPSGSNKSRRANSNSNNSGGNRRSRQPRGSAFSAPADAEDASNGDASSGGFLRDEDVLIAFMPYLKGDNPEAARIHEEYQKGGDQRAFLRAARDFLARARRMTTDESSSQQSPAPAAALPSEVEARLPLGQAASSSGAPPAIDRYAQGDANSQFSPTVATRSGDEGRYTHGAHHHDRAGGLGGVDDSIPRSDSGLDSMKSIENGLAALLTEDPVVAVPPVQQSRALESTPPSVWGSGIGVPPSPALQVTPPRHSQPAAWGDVRDPIAAISGPPGYTTPRAAHSGSQSLGPPTTSPTSSLAAQSHNHHAPHIDAAASPWNQRVGGSPQMQRPSQPAASLSSMSLPQPMAQPSQNYQLPGSPAPFNLGSPHSTPRTAASASEGRHQPLSLVASRPESPTITPPASAVKHDGANGTTSKKARDAPPPKRTWMHFDEQPGRVFVNGLDGADPSVVLYFAPRQELTAVWSIPLDYLHKCRPGCTTLEQAISGLTVGLFRRGCIENGVQASIISKKVVGEDSRSYDFRIDSPSNSVRGKVPFYSPRTPGHVLFRLYWEQDSVKTLAMGPTLHIRVLENDFDSSIRFILSNFKGKKSNPTSLSSLNSLAQVLETRVSTPNESAARAVFGCIQEARKVLEACASDYLKTTNKLAQLEVSVEVLRKQVEEEDAKSHDVSELSHDDGDEDEHGLSEVQISLREKSKTLLSGRASCERKWRDSQLSFASILKSTVLNQSMNVLLRRDMLAKMRLEYALFCPLCEEFAVPTETAKMWYEPLRDLPQNVTNDDFLLYAQARARMQMKTLGFEPNFSTLSDILFPHNRTTPSQRTMDPKAVNVFNVMSTAMGQWYQELFADEDRVVRQREMIRHHTEKCVQECGAFPPGTRVVIFGSSANGFGSPKSDIDMCLQLPIDGQPQDDEKSGFTAMSKLAEYLETHGMKDVDTCRLTARIPVIKFYCPDPVASGDNVEAIECDLSMHNPLAVLNTALLRTYAEITPVTRVLASIVKRWAKARDINNPARHTLSSYGYIIMLLHFMTYHKRTGNGLISPVAAPEGDPKLRQQPAQPSPPLLPNLQWMDPMWPNFPRGTPYRDLPSIPRNFIQHPMEEGKSVNTYFYRPSTPNDKAVLQMLFPGQDLSLAILLASFFRYYAYEFDYKRFVVSLHSTAARGLVEREVKAELDGWRHYSASLTVEDPFETFYDVAHVLRGGYYHRIRREFAVAYTKIADAASGRTTSNWKGKDIANLSGQELIDWICEPVANDRDQGHLEADGA